MKYLSKDSDSIELILNFAFALLFLECLREDNTTTKFVIFSAVFISFLIVRIFLINSNIIQKYNSYFLYLAIFIIYSFIMVLSDNAMFPDESRNMIKRLAINFVVFIFISQFFKIKKNINEVVDLIISICVVFLIYTVVVSIPTIFSMRLGAAVGYNANSIAVFCGYTAALAYYRYLSNKKKYIIYIIAFLLLCIILTGSRKGLITIAFCVAFINLFTTKKRQRAFKLCGLVAICALLLGLILFIPIFYNLIGYRVAETLNLLISGETEESSMTVRMKLIEVAMEKIVENPWKGYGLNAFRFYDSERGLYTHNNFVELLFSGGIPLVIIYYSMYLITIIKAISLLKKSDNKTLLITIIAIEIIFVINSFAMVTYYSKYDMIMQMFAMHVISCEKVSRRKING